MKLEDECEQIWEYFLKKYRREQITHRLLKIKQNTK